MTFQGKTKILFAVAFLISGAVGYVFNKDYRESPALEGVGDKVFSKLEEQLESIDEIRLTGPEGAITLRRLNDNWVVEERNNFLASEGLVSDLLLGLAGAEKFNPRTADEKFYDRLGLVDRSIEISALSGGQEIASLKTGDQFFSPTGEGVMTFSLDPKTNRAWTFSGIPEVSIDPSFWLSTNLLGLSETRIKRLEVSIGNNPVWVVSKESPFSPGFTLEGENSNLADLRAVNDAGMGATDLHFDDVQDREGLVLFKVAEARYLTFDGLTVTLEFFDQDGLILTSLFASYDESVLLSSDTPSVLPDAPADGAVEVQALNRIWQGRVFQIPLNKLAEILKFRQEFFRTQSGTN